MGRKLLNFLGLEYYSLHVKAKLSLNCVFLKKASGIKGINISIENFFSISIGIIIPTAAKPIMIPSPSL